jgi:hypothetical protein
MQSVCNKEDACWKKLLVTTKSMHVQGVVIVEEPKPQRAPREGSWKRANNGSPLEEGTMG